MHMHTGDEVEQALNDARLDAGIRWSELADKAGLSVETLYRYRKGTLRTEDSTRKLERVLGLPRGYLAALERGETPPAEHDEVEKLQQIAADLQRQMADLITRLDAYKHTNPDND